MQGWGTEPGKPEAEGLRQGGGGAEQPTFGHFWEQPTPSLPPHQDAWPPPSPFCPSQRQHGASRQARRNRRRSPMLSRRPTRLAGGGFAPSHPQFLREKEVARSLPAPSNGSGFSGARSAQSAPPRAIAPRPPFLPFFEQRPENKPRLMSLRSPLLTSPEYKYFRQRNVLFYSSIDLQDAK